MVRNVPRVDDPAGSLGRLQEFLSVLISVSLTVDRLVYLLLHILLLLLHCHVGILRNALLLVEFLARLKVFPLCALVTAA